VPYDEFVSIVGFFSFSVANATEPVYIVESTQTLAYRELVRLEHF
jgi:hypothetical protein